jgi:hypothetical protein
MNFSIKYKPGKGFFFNLGILFYLFILNGCALNPATGQHEFMMVSEGQEFEIGRKIYKHDREELGFYL